MSLELETKPQTVLLVVGPSCSGKTHFTTNFLIPQLQNLFTSPNHKANIQHISSDQIRADLLGYTSEKGDPLMLQASKLAYDTLYSKLNQVTSFPINADFVIVDTTGLNKEFRDKIASIALENQYNLEMLIFDYENTSEFFAHLDPSIPKRVVVKHVERLRTEVYKNLDRKSFNKIHKIKTPDFENIQVSISNVKNYLRNFLDSSLDYKIFGDVHGCYQDMINLLAKNNFKVESGKIVSAPANTKVIFLGDIIDKGADSVQMVEFVLNNQEHCIFVLGNHENYVFQRLTVPKFTKVSDELEKSYFTSIPEFQDKVNLLKQLVDISYPFVRTKQFIVTHAPCLNKYLGKVNGKAIKSQRNFVVAREENLDYDKIFDFLRQDSEQSYPYHVFGHITFERKLVHKNKFGIDTGCVYGNELTCLSVTPEGKLFWSSVQSILSKVDKSFISLFKKNEVDLSTLDPTEQKKIDSYIKNKINFISGTMCPADKDLDTNILESLDKGFEYFKSKGISEIVIQKKYMGSRCNIYLFKDIANSYAVSRNGFVIKNVPELSKIYEKLAENFQGMFYDLIVLDGELCPWSVLGKGLIDQTFKAVEFGVESELKTLQEFEFNSQYDSSFVEMQNSGFLSDVNNMPKKGLLSKYGSKYETYMNLRNVKKTDLDSQQKYLDVYKEQLQIFGSEGEVEFKPFNILKLVLNGQERLYHNEPTEQVFRLISNDTCLVVNLNSEQDLLKAKEFYHSVTTEDKMEGIVLKPRFNRPGVAPYMKVRNSNYLTLVYGYDYLDKDKYSKLIKEKGIKSKLNISIKEAELGNKMLEIPYSKLTRDNLEYVRLLSYFVQEENKEKSLDPRL